MAQGIVNIIREWLLGPRAQPEECSSCETLREQLAFANYDRKILLENFVKVAMPREMEKEEIDLAGLEPINQTKSIPWRVKQQQLEQNARDRAAHLKRGASGGVIVTPESISKLETELGIGKEETNGAVQEAVR